MKKTNAMRILDQAKINYDVLTYEFSDGMIDGIAVAGKINRSNDEVFKTLVAQGSQSFYVFIIPVHHELDLKKAATAASEKKIQLIPVKDLTKLTGYVRGGCSPVGMKKHYASFVDESARLLTSMIVSAGLKGLQMELAPEDLIRIAQATFVSLV
ncbi:MULTISPECIES: Cys-tRNA(Pro) deacylase [unclassified Fusibacter]|uniref:Cys-tRNA(Pro) deacylase n=1 Tax=unclassified Fusibacter TaxID=2624464 RepID=UPI001012D4DF|nr:MULTISPECIES: Cys-tRNA(Pro) deacylase [unclassified Fusibacter]MCK8060945.1 Cys-tRNA(Pro) deacylase [Fusibacter sp. A2]NPE23241.1 Cys-tRNA(Pro) deacylase [Fusibacter sp. A1]RXV59595.1 Cys-tRNA(Pro) deacylase [Fusibacter sp. A1]